MYGGRGALARSINAEQCWSESLPSYDRHPARGVAMWLIVAFSMLGLLVGNLVGLSATSVVTPLLGLLFAFAGSSVIAFLHKLTQQDRKVASYAMTALSVACLVGIYSGVLVNEYRLLTPKHRRWQQVDTAATRAAGVAVDARLHR